MKSSMTTDDIQRKLILLPAGWAEENAQSWERVIPYYQRLVFDNPNSKFRYLLDLVQTISKTEQVKLFKNYPSREMLIISTSSMKEEPIYGDVFIVVGVIDETLTRIIYCHAEGGLESVDCRSNEIMSRLQALLDRLWAETRGKKSA